ncbi:NUDIX hydrolase [Nesterenkonia salmonea]|uniref:NUDIX hydrolase n=1 Tax=Nesterenkonia salmonea TaxID=1804987 RepID=A0A5R9BD80_9MICC|nr:NUDIX hydrolase [Nesterenkonia salmonea]TLP98585.1 NUDIX hydrolase [Nesterenkonia salmonea]
MNLSDSPAEHPVTLSGVLLSTPVFNVAEERFRFGESGEELTRVFITHPGAVAVVAVDAEDRVLLIKQYRHPVRMDLWEIPAGLLDVEGEPMLTAAQRELAEETDLTAASWHTLVDFYTTPGAQNEAIRVYLAEGLTELPHAERHVREAEEAEMEFAWVDLADAVEAALSGHLHNPSAIIGILALYAVRSGSGRLRDAEACWDHHPRGLSPA